MRRPALGLLAACLMMGGIGTAQAAMPGYDLQPNKAVTAERHEGWAHALHQLDLDGTKEGTIILVAAQVIDLTNAINNSLAGFDKAIDKFQDLNSIFPGRFNSQIQKFQQLKEQKKQFWIQKINDLRTRLEPKGFSIIGSVPP